MPEEREVTPGTTFFDGAQAVTPTSKFSATQNISQPTVSGPSRRSVPLKRSLYPFSQGDPG